MTNLLCYNVSFRGSLKRDISYWKTAGLNKCRASCPDVDSFSSRADFGFPCRYELLYGDRDFAVRNFPLLECVYVPIGKNAGQFISLQQEIRGSRAAEFFISGHECFVQYGATRLYSLAQIIKQWTMQIVEHDDKIKCLVFKWPNPAFKIVLDPIDSRVSGPVCFGKVAINCCNFPAMIRQPKTVTPATTGKIKCSCAGGRAGRAM